MAGERLHEPSVEHRPKVRAPFKQLGQTTIEQIFQLLLAHRRYDINDPHGSFDSPSATIPQGGHADVERRTPGGMRRSIW